MAYRLYLHGSCSAKPMAPPPTLQHQTWHNGEMKILSHHNCAERNKSQRKQINTPEKNVNSQINYSHHLLWLSTDSVFRDSGERRTVTIDAIVHTNCAHRSGEAGNAITFTPYIRTHSFGQVSAKGKGDRRRQWHNVSIAIVNVCRGGAFMHSPNNSEW